MGCGNSVPAGAKGTVNPKVDPLLPGIDGGLSKFDADSKSLKEILTCL
jgi:hypothetical protein